MHRFAGLACRGFAIVLVCAGLPAASVALSAQPAAAALPSNCTGKTTVTCTFNYNGANGSDGSAQAFTVPAKATVATIDTWGAQGGGSEGGLGGHERTTLAVTPGETLQVFVGGQPTSSTGGFNGGGSGATTRAGGGGASDVRRAPAGLADRLVVAGGGGGEGVHTINGAVEELFVGGSGGAMPGAQSSASDCTAPSFADFCGGGGSTTGGALGVCDIGTPSVGTEGQGGAGDVCGAGGGGGYFGGGGGGLIGAVFIGQSHAFVGPGGGGSGRVATGVNQAHETGVRSGHGLVTISYSTKPVPPLGAAACVVSGTASFAKPLTVAPSAKVVKVTVKLVGNSCDSANVVGGKAPITDVAVKATLYVNAGSTCSSALGSEVKPQKVQVKWQGRNTKNKLTTVAVTNTTAVPFAYSVLAPVFPFGGAVLTDPKKPFVNSHIAANLVTAPSSTLQTMCASPGGLVTVNLVGVIGVFA